MNTPSGTYRSGTWQARIEAIKTPKRRGPAKGSKRSSMDTGKPVETVKAKPVAMSMGMIVLKFWS
jgi:hypothetical protein